MAPEPVRVVASYRRSSTEHGVGTTARGLDCVVWLAVQVARGRSPAGYSDRERDKRGNGVPTDGEVAESRSGQRRLLRHYSVAASIVVVRSAAAIYSSQPSSRQPIVVASVVDKLSATALRTTPIVAGYRGPEGAVPDVVSIGDDRRRLVCVRVRKSIRVSHSELEQTENDRSRHSHRTVLQV